MAKRPLPGLAFSMPTEVGFLVGLFTHETPKTGSVVWVATPTFEQQPTLEQARQIGEWRWPILFPLAAAIRQSVVAQIGQIPIPEELQSFPTMRSGHGKIGWVAFIQIDGVTQLLGPTTDRSLPINLLVNDTALREKVVSGWRPEDHF